MASENALVFLGRIETARALPPAILIAGPQAFLREYVVDAIARRLTREGLQYRTFQIANASDFSSVVEELRAPDLFAPKRMLVCRVMRSFRDRGDDGAAASSDDTQEKETRGGDAGLIGAVTEARAPNHLVVVYEKDAAPAKIRRAAETAGTMVNCMRPFDNQLAQYAQIFARGFELKLSNSAADLLISRHGGDLGAIANALGKIAIRLDKGASIEAADLTEQGPSKLPEPFEIAESLSSGRSAAALAQLTRAIAGGRDVFEILAVEIIPVMRRMMLAASMLAARKSTYDIAGALGFGPSSPLATRAIEGARRFGLARLERVYRRASELDEGFKNGQIKGREEALSSLVLELMSN
jgi:DNA polymerase III delta subunit